MTDKRVVIDTNILVSAFLSRTSIPAQAFNRAIEQDRPLVSAATLSELMRIFLSPKFDPFVPHAQREALLLRFAPLVEVVEVVEAVQVCRDPDDDRILEVAVNGLADLVVTGDHDLLALDPFRGIRISSPRAYLDLAAGD